MILTFRHKGLEAFFETGSKAGIQAQHATRLRLQLAKLNAAQNATDMDLPNWRLHPLKDNLVNYWAVWVDKNWRLTFTFDDNNAMLVDYQDYH